MTKEQEIVERAQRVAEAKIDKAVKYLNELVREAADIEISVYFEVESATTPKDSRGMVRGFNTIARIDQQRRRSQEVADHLASLAEQGCY